ncbi:hypothetical protein WJX74_000631 [Apatococcus lobatus]|uniref:Multiple myeloma tumor-associated protein 2-like N-terminal domain-containing protein n=1 Tax=Apatococcus lobatus TaxID=904363 RepID=A0AAW1SFT0_9CHLO
MSLYNGPPRGGNRGGKDQFNWESVKGDKDREFYLGHSVKATTGRWQKGKDVFWYTREKKDEGGHLELERQAVKQREEDLMLEAMGMKPKAKKAIAPAKLAKHEMEQLMNGSIHDEEPEAAPPDSADPTKGIGFKPNQLKAPGEAGHEVMKGVGINKSLPPPPPMPNGHAAAASRPGPLLSEKQLKKLLKAQKKEARHAKKAAKKDKKEKKAAKKAAEKDAERARSDDSSATEGSSASGATPPLRGRAADDKLDAEPPRKRQRHDSRSPPPMHHHCEGGSNKYNAPDTHSDLAQRRRADGDATAAEADRGPHAINGSARAIPEAQLGQVEEPAAFAPLESFEFRVSSRNPSRAGQIRPEPQKARTGCYTRQSTHLLGWRTAGFEKAWHNSGLQATVRSAFQARCWFTCIFIRCPAAAAGIRVHANESEQPFIRPRSQAEICSAKWQPQRGASDEEYWMSILDACPEPESPSQEFWIALSGRAAAAEKPHKLTINFLSHNKPESASVRQSGTVPETALDLNDSDVSEWNSEEPSSPSLGSLLNAIDAIPELQARLSFSINSKQLAKPLSASATTRCTPCAVNPRVQEPEFDVFELNNVPQLDLDFLDKPSETHQPAHPGKHDPKPVPMPAGKSRITSNGPLAPQPEAGQDVRATPKSGSWNQLSNQSKPSHAKKGKRLLGFRSRAAYPLPAIAESDLDGHDIGNLSNGSPKKNGAVAQVGQHTIAVPINGKGKWKIDHSAGVHSYGMHAHTNAAGHDLRHDRLKWHMRQSDVPDVAASTPCSKRNGTSAPDTSAYAGCNASLSHWPQLYKGLVGGLGEEDCGEPMKLRMTAVVANRGNLPAAFDVKGALQVKCKTAQQLRDNTSLPMSSQEAFYKNKCRMHLVDETTNQLSRLQQLANEGLVLLAGGYQFVPTEAGLDVQEHGSWALVPSVDMPNKPSLTVYQLPEDGGSLELSRVDLPLQLPKATTSGNNAAVPMVI